MEIRTSRNIHNTISMLYYNNRGKFVINKDRLITFQDKVWVAVDDLIKYIDENYNSGYDDIMIIAEEWQGLKALLKREKVGE